MHVNCGVLGAPPPIDGLEKAAGQRQFLKLNWTENGLAKWLAEGAEPGSNVLLPIRHPAKILSGLHGHLPK